MSTIRSQIITEVIRLLNVNRPVGVPEARRLRTTPNDAGQYPGLNVYPGDEPVESIHNATSPAKERTLTLYFEARVSGDAPDELADPILDWITTTLGETRLPTVAYPRGLALDIQEVRTQWRVSQQNQVFFVALASYEIRYKTKRNNQSAQS